jgi:hypothetical protein
MFTVNAIYYAVKHLFMVACPSLIPKISILVNDDKMLATVSIDDKKIIFTLSSPEEMENLLFRTAVLEKVNTADGKYTIPVMLKKGLPFAVLNDNELKIHADIISLSFIMLSRYEETVICERDKYDRFESKNSIAVKYGFIDFPIVDEYALILKQYLILLFPHENFAVSKSKIIPTHDIDEVRRFAGIKKSLRTLLGDVYVYKNPLLFFKSFLQCLSSIYYPAKDPYIKSIYTLVNISLKYNLTSEFYFMGAQQSQLNSGYNIEAVSVRNAMSYVRKNGMIVGFHGGFETYKNKFLYKQEKERIASAVGSEVTSGRQHYLRFDIFSTFAVLEDAGLLCDSTLGFADREGFRCGTSYAYHPYDLKNDMEFKITERPLIVMDATLFEYRQYTANEAYKQMVKLYERCKTVGGNFTILWHNTTANRRQTKFKRVYMKFLNNQIKAKCE